ncbi:MAG: hypothetical protein EA401_01280, partial [Planctomycetota bacterium]
MFTFATEVQTHQTQNLSGRIAVIISLFYMNVMGKEDRIVGNPNLQTRSIQTNDARLKETQSEGREALAIPMRVA